MSPDIRLTNFAVLTAVDIITELLRFILIEIEVHTHLLSIGLT